MICKHLMKFPSQMLTICLCCVLNHTSSLSRQRKNILTRVLQMQTTVRLFWSHRCCVSAKISVVIFTPSLNPSMYASRSDREISDS